MPPLPKPPGTHARRHRASTARQLEVVPDLPVPKLPRGRKWQQPTKDWWRDIWASPMAPEFEASDVHGLLMLAVLVDEFWEAPTAGKAAEIRLQRQCFGLSPIDRRRLQWEIARGSEAEARTRRRQGSGAPPVEQEDPRHLLQS